MKENMINVFFCTDNNYAVPTYISIYSMMYNYCEEFVVKVYVLTPSSFTKNNESLLNSLSTQFDCLELHIIDMRDSYISVSINSPHISTATMYRLMIPNIMEKIDNSIEKCIYLDSDTVVEGNIIDLFKLEIDEYYIGGVLDCFLSDNRLIKLRDSLGIPTLDNYINAGVLLFNLYLIRKDGIDKLLEKEAFNSSFRYNDQDVINSVCFSKIKIIPLKYNTMCNSLYYDDRSYLEKYGINNVFDARKDPLILHYILPRKPWMCKNTVMGDKWWKYVNMQDESLMKGYIAPFIKEHKSSLSENARETIKKVLIEIRIYNVVRKLLKIF